MATRYVAYYRVSTQKQRQSGLGLEAQQVAVRLHVQQRGGEIVAEHTEIESGKNSSRPVLAAAIAQCKRDRAVLVIAKLDRLSRSVSFISTLMEGGVEFVAVDFPAASRLLLHILAAVAENEREQISQRTKAALAAAKARGVQLGTHGRMLAAENRERAGQFARIMRGPFEQSIAAGNRTLLDHATFFNRAGLRTVENARFSPTTVHRLQARLDTLRT